MADSEPPDSEPPDSEPPDSEPDDRLQRLDPDLAAARARAPRPGSGPAPVRAAQRFDPHRLQWVAGALAIVLVIAYSAYQITSKGVGTAGIPAGKPARVFAAPLATSNLIGDANLKPPCTAADHDPRALNVCLLLARGPLVLAFFVTDSGSCQAGVSAAQAIAPQWRAQGIQFAAVAVRAGRAAAAAAVRKHHWTIPVAYDRDGAVGAGYGVEVCPLLELIRRDGIVAARLIGKRWTRPAALSAQVAVLATP
jgi:redoxin